MLQETSITYKKMAIIVYLKDVPQGQMDIRPHSTNTLSEINKYEMNVK